ncbi:hypothetical protein [Amycolatopsis pigmentata]|uniref:Uncharacterized protein n=1 Tax=Amycolatopsis pigmentata TaxID=450801 RepID=A0ABW5G0A6_9PSEU
MRSRAGISAVTVARPRKVSGTGESSGDGIHPKRPALAPVEG